MGRSDQRTVRAGESQPQNVSKAELASEGSDAGGTEVINQMRGAWDSNPRLRHYGRKRATNGGINPTGTARTIPVGPTDDCPGTAFSVVETTTPTT